MASHGQLEILQWVGHIFVKVLSRVEHGLTAGENYANIRLTRSKIINYLDFII